MDDIDQIVQEYKSRFAEAKSFVAQVVSFFSNEPSLYPKDEIPIIHSIKSRTKDPEHLRDKLHRKYEKGESISKDDFLERITDLAGVRVLHLYNDQFPLIH